MKLANLARELNSLSSAELELVVLQLEPGKVILLQRLLQARLERLKLRRTLLDDEHAYHLSAEWIDLESDIQCMLLDLQLEMSAADPKFETAVVCQPKAEAQQAAWTRYLHLPEEVIDFYQVNNSGRPGWLAAPEAAQLIDNRYTGDLKVRLYLYFAPQALPTNSTRLVITEDGTVKQVAQLTSDDKHYFVLPEEFFSVN